MNATIRGKGHFEAANRELLRLGVVTHNSAWVGYQRPQPAVCKRKDKVICQLTTVGYATLKAGWSATSFKPYSRAEAKHHKSEMRDMLQLLEEYGEYNIGAHFRVDCTVLARRHDHHDIHIGENV